MHRLCSNPELASEVKQSDIKPNLMPHLLLMWSLQTTLSLSEFVEQLESLKSPDL
ncbi:unnamed protein product [Dovyalis caffra]|uniref:Uncharacterized protein n=1 Tax=Dovyalis caffra TaxID=77055 RepID=A0AAV1S9T0_9ROSI|nr:unnamed protein product [Dovyalis caffra]